MPPYMAQTAENPRISPLAVCLTLFGPKRMVRPNYYGSSRRPGPMPVRQSAKVRALAFFALGHRRMRRDV
jgi:hypothetical protein